MQTPLSRLKKKPEPWTQEHTKIVQHIKEKGKIFTMS